MRITQPRQARAFRRSCGFTPLFATVIVCAAAFAPASAGSYQSQDDPAASDPAENQTDSVHRRLQLIGEQMLLRSGNDVDIETRRMAAEELLSMDRPEASTMLNTALRSGEPAIVLAVVQALEGIAEPDPTLLDGLVDALAAAEDSIVYRLAVLLTRFEDAGLERVIELARDGAQPIEARVNAARALSSFSRRASIDRLILLTDPGRHEDQRLVDAAYDSLYRMTSLDIPREHTAWREWWSEARDAERGEWLIPVMQRQAQQIGRMRQDFQALANRYVNALQTLYRELPQEQELERLPLDLRDPLAQVREFALGRVDRLLRDAVRLPEPILTALAERLADHNPALRLRAARLHGLISYDGLDVLIAERLQNETDPAVIHEFVDILAKQGSAAGIDRMIELLSDPQSVNAAASALWRISQIEPFEAETRRRIVKQLQERIAESPTPDTVRLVISVVDDDQVATFEPMLSHDDPDLRDAAASAFAARGLIEPLRARAADPVVYPHVIAAMLRGERSIDTFNRLAELSPPNGRRPIWREAIIEFCSSLSPEALLYASSKLRDLDVALELRRDVLKRALGMTVENGQIPVRNELLLQLARVQSDLAAHVEAHTAMEARQGEEEGLAVRELRFRYAIQAGAYERAVALQPNWEAWLDLLDFYAEHNAEFARPLLEQFEQRFKDQLSEDGQRRYEELVAHLNGDDEAKDDPSQQSPPEPA